jgi:hypothetical protein
VCSNIRHFLFLIRFSIVTAVKLDYYYEFLDM